MQCGPTNLSPGCSSPHQHEIYVTYGAKESSMENCGPQPQAWFTTLHGQSILRQSSNSLKSRGPSYDTLVTWAQPNWRADQLGQGFVAHSVASGALESTLGTRTKSNIFRAESRTGIWGPGSQVECSGFPDGGTNGTHLESRAEIVSTRSLDPCAWQSRLAFNALS